MILKSVLKIQTKQKTILVAIANKKQSRTPAFCETTENPPLCTRHDYDSRSLMLSRQH